MIRLFRAQSTTYKAIIAVAVVIIVILAASSTYAWYVAERIVPKEPGEYVIRLEATDRGGNRVVASTFVWVIGKGEAFYLESGDSVLLMAGPDGCTYISAGAHVHEEGHTH